MTLLQKIRDDLLEARKARSVRARYLSTLLGDVEAVGKAVQRDATDAEVVAILKKYIKNVEATHDALMKSDADVDEQLTTNHGEKLTYESYLPKQLTEDQLRTVISELQSLGAVTVGDIMAGLKKNYGGMYDGALASKLGKEAGERAKQILQS